MKELQDRILKDGQVIGTNILKVNKFINHQVDPVLMEHIGEDFANHFADKGITKVVTIESSGIAPALMAAAKMNVPLVILKKQPSKTLHNDLYQTQVTSFTTEKSYELTLSRDVISEDDNILLIDDFMADGEAATGAIRLLRMAHATVAGIGILIEKSFQPGRRKINEQGYEVYSLARIKYMDEYQIDFIEENIKDMQSVTKMLEDGLTPEEIALKGLKGLDGEILDSWEVQYYCDCSRERTEQVLITLGKDELAKLAEEEPVTEVCCHFCDNKYRFTSEELKELIKRI